MKSLKLQEVNNLNVYTNSKTVDYYDRLTGLQPCEQYVFSKYLNPKADVLDLGVGGGRTTPYLSSDARRYVGVDYSSAMTDICQKKFPELPFHTLDAADLSYFQSSQFDVVVFSFNGIDYLYPDAQRVKCLNEVNRVLKSGGIFIFSVHNARVVFIRPQLNSVATLKKVWRLIRTIKNIWLFLKQLRRKAFYDGTGYITDTVHGNLMTHVSIPRFVQDELAEAGLSVLEVVSGNYPICSGDITSPWYYYVAKKI